MVCCIGQITHIIYYCRNQPHPTPHSRTLRHVSARAPPPSTPKSTWSGALHSARSTIQHALLTGSHAVRPHLLPQARAFVTVPAFLDVLSSRIPVSVLSLTPIPAPRLTHSTDSETALYLPSQVPAHPPAYPSSSSMPSSHEVCQRHIPPPV